jgi:DNA polymerase III gamma/tau subunit
LEPDFQEVLESIKHMSTCVAILTSLQQELIADKRTLVNQDVTISDLLEAFQRLGTKVGTDGQGVIKYLGDDDDSKENEGFSDNVLGMTLKIFKGFHEGIAQAGKQCPMQVVAANKCLGLPVHEGKFATLWHDTDHESSDEDDEPSDKDRESSDEDDEPSDKDRESSEEDDKNAMKPASSEETNKPTAAQSISADKEKAVTGMMQLSANEMECMVDAASPGKAAKRAASSQHEPASQEEPSVTPTTPIKQNLTAATTTPSKRTRHEPRKSAATSTSKKRTQSPATRESQRKKVTRS